MNWPDLWVLGKSFLKTISGTDYFHQKQPIGRYFYDDRCYYNDLRGKANWKWQMSDGVPIIEIPALKKRAFFPITILQWGIGSFDRWCEAGSGEMRMQAQAAGQWLMNNIEKNGDLDNLFPQTDLNTEYFSANSAMAYGQALSLLIRLVTYLPDFKEEEKARRVIQLIFDRMNQGLEEGGTCSLVNGRPVYYECCTKDKNIILNGWIFAIFGLVDYRRYIASKTSGDLLDDAIASLMENVDLFVKSNWTDYDLNGRIASPFYHDLHIAQLLALGMLVNQPTLVDLARRLDKKNTSGRRAYAVVVKIVQKLRENNLHFAAT